MKPTIGRIVLYSLPTAYWEHVADTDRIRPAIVTRVIDDTRINLRVINDPTDHFLVSPMDQVAVEEGAGIAGRWQWPERV